MPAAARRPPLVPAPLLLDRYLLRRGAGIDGLHRDALPLPRPSGREVLVRMHAVALNHRDLMVAGGTSGPADRDLVPASDGAGEVVAVGADVAAFAVGDRVIGSFFPDWQDGAPSAATLAGALGGSLDGMLASHVLLPESAWVALPPALDFVAAATLPCAGVTAWHALFGLDPLPAGATVVLPGTGGVSIWALQLAHAAGLRTIVTSSDDGKLERVRALGADATINYRRHPQWEAEVLRLTAGAGAERVLDLGGSDTIARSIAALRIGGTVAVIGRLSGAAPAQFDPAALFLGARRLQGLMVGSRAMTRALVDFVATHGVQPVVDRVFAFDEAAAAYHHLASGRHLGKVVVTLP